MYKALGHLQYVCLRTILLKSRHPINRRNKSRESTILKIEFFYHWVCFFSVTLNPNVTLNLSHKSKLLKPIGSPL